MRITLTIDLFLSLSLTIPLNVPKCNTKSLQYSYNSHSRDQNASYIKYHTEVCELRAKNGNRKSLTVVYSDDLHQGMATPGTTFNKMKM